MTAQFEQDARNTVRRIPDRGSYDRDTVYEILDAGFLCHVGFTVEDQPFVIPTLYGRSDDQLYLHGAPASRMLKTLADGVRVCLTVTHVDGLVLARSAFHHSINYRSVVVFGTATEVSGDEKEHGLFVISEQVLKGRWDESRTPTEKELQATSVLKLKIDSASAKIRTGGPKDEEDDYSLPIWAGVVPIHQTFGPVETDVNIAADIPVPASVETLPRHND
jgi:nitroimidazol reductase NimA-like FMN-containing flavoprotein (pyridoxamine 5'-phosphate oxidase superfamily)